MGRCRYVLRRNKVDVLKRTFDFEMNERKGGGKPWRRRVEEQIE